MMNSSSGFSNSSLMGNSTGFKKRNLLRPASGALSKKLEFLRSLDVSQSEPVIASFLKGEVAAMEEEIHLLDKDRRLRQGDTGLQKGYVTALRKWLQNNQTFPEREEEDTKVLRYLGVDNFEGGFRKLWRVLGHLDLTIAKATQLQVIHLLLYDEMFDGLGKDSPRSSSLLSQISTNGYSPCSFQVTQVLMDRSKDLFAACRRGSKQEQRGDSSREETGQLITQLKAENAKLNRMLEQLSRERDQDQKRQSEREAKESREEGKKKESSKENQSPSGERALDQLREIEEKYQEHVKFLNGEKTTAECQVTELKARVSSLESQLKAAGEKVPSVSFPSAPSGSYEEALMEEMEKMKRGFLRKIDILTDDFSQRERELRRREADFKNENDKIRWEKSLLLKKFDLISK